MTTPSNLFGNVLIRAYAEAGGPRFSTALIVPDRPELSFPGWAAPLVAAKMLGVEGTRAYLSSKGIDLAPRRWKDKGLSKSWLGAIAETADALRTSASPNSSEGRQALADARPDVLLSIGVPLVLTRTVLEIPKIGALNVHHGLLPKYRGHFASFWEIIERQEHYGVTVHAMAPRVDAGSIMAQTLFRWDEADGFADLMIRKKWASGTMLARTLNEAIADGGKALREAQSARAESSPGRPYPFPQVADLLRWSWPKRAPLECAVEGRPAQLDT